MVRQLSASDVRAFLRGVRLRGVPTPPDFSSTVSRPAAPPSAASQWGAWGSEQPGDVATFPRGTLLPGGIPYDESTVFNGRNGAKTPADKPRFSAQPATVNLPLGAVPYVSSAIFTPFPFTVGTGSNPLSPIIVTHNTKRAALLVQNLSGVTNLFINFGAPANLNLGFIIVPGGAALFDQFTPINDIHVFFGNAVPQNGVIFEGTRDF